MPDTGITKEVLTQVLAAHNGCVKAAAAALRTSRQTATKYIHRYDLDAYAARLRNAAGVPGRRDAMPAEERVDPEEAARIKEAVEAADWNATKAAEALGMEREEVWRKMRQYGIEKPQAPWEQRRREMMEKLEAAGWVLSRAEEILGIKRPSIVRQMRELSIPKDLLRHRRRSPREVRAAKATTGSKMAS